MLEVCHVSEGDLEVGTKIELACPVSPPLHEKVGLWSRSVLQVSHRHHDMSPLHTSAYFLRTETFYVMIIPLSFPGIGAVTKFKLPSCPENVSFMCVLCTQAFISIWFWNLGATQRLPLACSHHVPSIFFTPEPSPTPPPFLPLSWKFLKVQVYLVIFYDLDLFGLFLRDRIRLLWKEWCVLLVTGACNATWVIGDAKLKYLVKVMSVTGISWGSTVTLVLWVAYLDIAHSMFLHVFFFFFKKKNRFGSSLWKYAQWEGQQAWGCC